MKVLILVSLVFAVLMISMASALTLTINKPTLNANYNSNKIDINLTASAQSDFYYLSVSGRWIQLCDNTINCIKNLNFREGSNSISFKAVGANGNADFKEISFNVDTKKPVITDTFPGSKAFTNGSEFSVAYNEDNLKEAKLFYDNKNMTLNCTSGKKQSCLTNLNLSAFDGKFIEYWFSLTDNAGNSAMSKKTAVKVDTTAPKNLDGFPKYEQNNDVVKFIFEVNELNLKEITFTDDSVIPLLTSSRVLCTRLDNGRCTSTRRFSSGTHNLVITATDKAGNSNILNSTTITV